MNVIRHIADRVAIMYLGEIVESGTTEQIFNNPNHPYTKALLNSVPSLKKKEISVDLKGDLPSPTNLPSGCKFHTRCKYCINVCTDEKPELKQIQENHFSACFMNEESKYY